MTRHRPVRRYPRTARVNEVVREVLADELERLSDPRLGLVTLTDVDVSADLRHADVYYSVWEPVTGRAAPAPAPAPAPVRAANPRARAGAGGDRPGAAAGPAETAAALRSAAPHLRAALGRQVRLKYLPELDFHVDPSIEAGRRIDEILAGLRRGEPGVERAGDRDGMSRSEGGSGRPEDADRDG
ncbi:MAG: ribosome-binding factor A [Acidimicrobiia bacterium]|nr:ribosome-binding factor A [Acidimicrobiia bacterium]